MTEAQLKAVAAAEEEILKILHDLAVDCGSDIANVEVDTRQFANLRVEIFLEDE